MIYIYIYIYIYITYLYGYVFRAHVSISDSIPFPVIPTETYSDNYSDRLPVSRHFSYRNPRIEKENVKGMFQVQAVLSVVTL